MFNNDSDFVDIEPIKPINEDDVLANLTKITFDPDSFLNLNNSQKTDLSSPETRLVKTNTDLDFNQQKTTERTFSADSRQNNSARLNFAVQQEVSKTTTLLSTEINSDLQDIKNQLKIIRQQLDTLLNFFNSKMSKKFNSSQTINGIFDGEKMVANNGETYFVPTVYASKTKLVQGDLLKLIITETGKFIFKPLKLVQRQRLLGKLSYNENNKQWLVYSQEKQQTFFVSETNVNFFHGQIGDEVIILVPAEKASQWATIENIIKNIN